MKLYAIHLLVFTSLGSGESVTEPPRQHHPHVSEAIARLEPQDPRLLGTWFRNVTVATPQGSLVTQIVGAFGADGSYLELPARAMATFEDGGLDSFGGEAFQGRWRVEGSTLLMSTEGSPFVPLAEFYIEGDRMLLTYYQDGSRQLWYRADP